MKPGKPKPQRGQGGEIWIYGTYQGQETFRNLPDKGSEANGEKIVKTGQKDEEVRQIQLPNPL